MIPAEMVHAGLLYVPERYVLKEAIERYTMRNPAFAQAVANSGNKNPDIPKTIQAYKELKGYIGFPPYSEPKLLASEELPIRDLRSHGEDFEFTFREDKAELRPDLVSEQRLAVKKLLNRGHGMLVAKPGQGKTNTFIWLMSKIKKSTIIFVHTSQLQKQWFRRFTEPDPKIGNVAWTNVTKEDIALLGDGKKKYSGQPIIIATLQMTGRSIIHNKEVMHKVGMAIVDECHHLSADTFHPCMAACRAFHKFGATATPYRTDKLDKIFYDHLGGIAAVMRNVSLTPTVNIWPFYTGVDLDDCTTKTGKPFLPGMINVLCASDTYNDFILGLALMRLMEGHKVVMISHRADHCVKIAARVRQEGYKANFIVASYTGPDDKPKTLSVKKREARYDNQFIAATPGCMIEGIDIPDISCVQFVTPFGAKNMVEQGCGRAQRHFPGKLDPVIDDVLQEDHRMLVNLGNKRRRHYGSFHWPVYYREGSGYTVDPVARAMSQHITAEEEF